MKSFREYVLARPIEFQSKKMDVPPNFSKFHVRWLLRKDAVAISEMDNGIDIQELSHLLSERDTVGFVCEAFDDIADARMPIGFFILKYFDDEMEVVRIKCLPQYESKFLDHAMPKIISKVGARLKKIYILDDAAGSPQFYARLKQYGFSGRQTNLGWEFVYQK